MRLYYSNYLQTKIAYILNVFNKVFDNGGESIKIGVDLKQLTAGDKNAGLDYDSKGTLKVNNRIDFNETTQIKNKFIVKPSDTNVFVVTNENTIDVKCPTYFQVDDNPVEVTINGDDHIFSVSNKFGNEAVMVSRSEAFNSKHDSIDFSIDVTDVNVESKSYSLWSNLIEFHGGYDSGSGKIILKGEQPEINFDYNQFKINHGPESPCIESWPGRLNDDDEYIDSSLLIRSNNGRGQIQIYDGSMWIQHNDSIRIDANYGGVNNRWVRLYMDGDEERIDIYTNSGARIEMSHGQIKFTSESGSITVDEIINKLKTL